MTTIYSQTSIEQQKIEFPKKIIKIEPAKNKYSNATTYYDVYQVADRFDPNISSSPPNVFVNTLEQRMNVYYSNDSIMKLNGIQMNARNRSLSLDYGK